MRLTDSTVTANGAADVAGPKLPRLVNTTCDKSVDLVHGGNWGICALD